MSNLNTTSSSDFPESNKGMHYETRCSDRVKILAWVVAISVLAANAMGVLIRPTVRPLRPPLGGAKETARAMPKGGLRSCLPKSTSDYKAETPGRMVFQQLNHFRRVATRYEKTARNFLAIITTAAIALWLR
jgi:hypothetical protein